MLQQLSAAGIVLLPSVQGEGSGVQSQEQEDKGDPTHLSR